MRAASDNTGYSIERVGAIAVNRYNPCRTVTDYEYKVGSVGMIQRIAVDFCGADPLICQGAIKESSSLYRKKYGRLSLAEVKEAFEMAAAKQLGDISIIAYKGVFTVAIFGEVIEAYSKVRDAIVDALDQAEKKEAQQEQEALAAARQEVYRNEVILNFKLLQSKNEQFGTIEKIPVQWPQILQDAGLLKSDPKLWIEAKSATAAKFKADTQRIRDLRLISTQEADKLESRLFTQVERERICQQIFEQPDVLPQELYLQASQLYGRILVFNQIANYVPPEHALMF